MAEDGPDFATILTGEIEEHGMDCASVDMLIDMANSGDAETVAMVLCDLVDQGNPGWSADITRHAMHVGDLNEGSLGTVAPDYSEC